MKSNLRKDRRNELKSAARTKALPKQQAETFSELEPLPPAFNQLPAKLIVAIDGWAQSGKNTAGELVAKQIGGVLVDSGRFYRALTKASLDAGYDLRDSQIITSFCRTANLAIRLVREGGKVAEVAVSVNGHCYTKEELNRVGLETSQVARIREVRDIVNNGLRLCQRYGRVVMLGRDIGGVVFPYTPYKFFLDASEKIREQRHRQTTQTSGAAKRDRNDASQVVFAENALLIDTGMTCPEEVRGIIVMDLLWRTAEIKALETQKAGRQ
jgi:cytidylate kinase